MPTIQGRLQVPGTNNQHLAYRLTNAVPPSPAAKTASPAQAPPQAQALPPQAPQPPPPPDVDVVFLHGLASDMRGTKARALEAHAEAKGFPLLCFDTRGHGGASGALVDHDVAEWSDDVALALAALAPARRHVLVGSSLGGWLALHHAIEHPAAVAGLLLVAPAVDFTEMVWQRLPAAQQQAAQRSGRLRIPSGDVPGGELELPYKLITSARERGGLLLRERLAAAEEGEDDVRRRLAGVPLRVLHGALDDAVPVEVSQRWLFDALGGAADARLTLVRDGDHRLSRPRDIRLLLRTLEGLLDDVAAAAAASRE